MLHGHGKISGELSNWLQFAGVSNFAFMDGTHLRGFHGDHGGGVSIKGGEFHFVSQSVAIDVDDRSYIASLQAFGGDGGLQNNAVMLFDHHVAFYALRGYAVTNLAATRPLSTIQMLCTSGDLPPGDGIEPTMTNFFPCND
jgi:hypothetical protein